MKLREMTRKGRARAAYFDADSVLGYIWDRLAAETDPAERARLLRSAGGCEYVRFDAYATAFGPDPVNDEGDCRDMADVLERSSRLLNLVAVIEHCAATGEPIPPWPQVPPTVRAAACVMAATPDLRERHAMLADLCRAAMPTDGGQAVETIVCLPAPGCQPLNPFMRTKTV